MNEQSAGSTLVSHNGMLSAETEEPPGTGYIPNAEVNRAKRHPYWNDIPNELWEDWRWQRQHAVRTTAQLAELIPLPPAEYAALERLDAKYRMAIPPYYFSLIDLADPSDPIRLQAVPDAREEVNLSGEEFDDPLEEDKDSPVPGLTHRYPDRALLVTTPVCTMYCRFCTRKRVTMDREGWDGPSRNEERMIEYVRDTRQIRDVIVSGGDPLTLPVSKLKWFINSLAAIDHVDVIRIGTRVPVTLPQRLFDPELINLLHSAGKIWIQTHFNHPVEITPEAERACRNLINAGMPVNNHAVLLKGVNDSVDTMRQLVRGLLRIKVRPYYLFHCDPVVGAGHFRTSVWKGMEIIEGLRGHVSGLGVPTYVVDGLHGAGKIPVMPNYLISASEQAVVLRNYEGLIFRYAPDDRVNTEPLVQSVGVSGVLSGGAGPIIPEGNRRLARRKKPVVDLELADIAPAATNGTTSNGTTSNGTTSNGTTSNGTTSNGINGQSTNGNGTNGHANGHGETKVNGKANGVKTNGTNGIAKTKKPAAANGHGSNGTNGHSANGANGHGTNGHGDNGHAANGGNGSAAKARNGKAKAAANGDGATLRLDMPSSLKSELLRRPMRKTDSVQPPENKG